MNHLVNIDTVEFIVRGAGLCLPSKTALLHDMDGKLLTSYQNRLSMGEEGAPHALHVRTLKANTLLKVEGALYAHFLGQNIVTGSDLRLACLKSLGKVLKGYDLVVSDGDRVRWVAGDIILKRVDLAVNYQFSSQEEVQAILRQIKLHMFDVRGQVNLHGSTVCWSVNKLSKPALIWYDKGAEVQQSRSWKSTHFESDIRRGCEGILRFEVRLRDAALRKAGITKVSDWNAETPLRVVSENLAALDFMKVQVARQQAPLHLPSALSKTYAIYKGGLNVKSELAPSTYFRHKKQLKDLGIDITLPYERGIEEVPLAQLLRLENAMDAVPEWLTNAGLHKELALKVRPRNFTKS